MPRNNTPKVKPDRGIRSKHTTVKVNPLIMQYLNRRHIPLRRVEVVDENNVMIYNQKDRS